MSSKKELKREILVLRGFVRALIDARTNEVIGFRGERSSEENSPISAFFDFLRNARPANENINETFNNATDEFVKEKATKAEETHVN